MNPMEGKTVYAGEDTVIHRAIVALVEKKTGLKMAEIHWNNPLYPFIYASVGQLWGASHMDFTPRNDEEITLAELEAMPDYVEPPKTKEMTVAEVSELVGCPVKIVE